MEMDVFLIQKQLPRKIGISRFLLSGALLCCGLLMLSTTATAFPQEMHAKSSSSHLDSLSRDGVPRICFDSVYYRALPGRVNYCLGLKDWHQGHYNNALELLKLAAGWGNKNAQYTLGLIYYGGHHVAADPALGIAWFKLANERHNDEYISLATKSAIRWATKAQKQRAEQLFQKMRHHYGDKVATERAWHHLQHWVIEHGPFASGCLKLYGAQAYAARMSSLHTSCIPIQAQRYLVQESAGRYFEGWIGTVTVEPLKQVPAPAASSEP